MTGTAKPNQTIRLFIIPKNEEVSELSFAGSLFASLFGTKPETGPRFVEVQTDDSGKWLAQPEFGNGDFAMTMQMMDGEGNVEDETVPFSFKVDASQSEDLIEPRQLGNVKFKNKDIESIELVQIAETRPFFYGRLKKKNLQVNTFWQSQLYSSSLLVDTDEREFITLAPELEQGRHHVSLYASDPLTKFRSSTLRIPFEVSGSNLYGSILHASTLDAGESMSQGALLLWAISGLVSFGAFVAIVRRRQFSVK